MHYLGMAAIVTDARVEYDVGIVISSILLAVVASTAGVWILFRLLALYPHIELLRISSSAVIAVAVNGVHYTGMAAAKYIHAPGSMSRFNASPTLSSRDATFGALIGTIIFCFVMMLITIADLRAWYYVNAKVVRSTDDMMKNLQALENLDATSKDVITKYRLIRGKKADAVLNDHSTCKISPNESALRRQPAFTDVEGQPPKVKNCDADETGKNLSSTAAFRYGSNDGTALERSV
jgi:Bacterial signalling protein N terminal repeat